MLNFWPILGTEPWWRRHPCPLLPTWEYDAADDQNPSHFSLSWLLLRVWTMAHVALGLDMEWDSDTLSAGILLPYLRIMLRLPMPTWFWTLCLKARRKGNKDDDYSRFC